MVSTPLTLSDQRTFIPLSAPVAQIFSTLHPHLIPAYIRLSDFLTNPAEIACANAVANYLSSRCGWEVKLAELEALSLCLWSIDDRNEGKSPLQGLLLETTLEPSNGASGVNAELAQYVGTRFEFAAAGSELDEPTLLRQ